MLARIEGGSPKACFREALPCKGSVNNVCLYIMCVDIVNWKQSAQTGVFDVFLELMFKHFWWLALVSWTATARISQY